MRSCVATLIVVLAACGSSADGTAGAGTTPEPRDTPATREAIPELEQPAPPGAETVLGTLEPAHLDATDEEQMQQVSGASAPRVFFVGIIPLLAIGNERTEEDEPRVCPVKIEAEGVTVFRGGCTDHEDVRWTGSAVIRGMNEEQRTGDITYRDFGFERTVDCPGGPRTGRWRANGRFVMEEEIFRIDVAFHGEGVDEECNDLLGTGAIEYEGRSSRTGSAVRWSGAGRYGWQELGYVEATTEDELVNQRNCRHEALMGQTVVRGAEHTVTFIYDGAGDCEEESTVSWSFDDQPQGELAGVACSASGAAPPSGWWLLVLAALVLRRRR